MIVNDKCLNFNKANPQYLRDVAMNGIGQWVRDDLRAQYASDERDDIHEAVFFVNGRRFMLVVTEVKEPK